MRMKDNFCNDYSDIGYPQILETLMNNQGGYSGYGFDNVTKELREYFCDLLKQQIDLYLLASGTVTNLTLISKALSGYEAVISVNSGHINVHETGAVEGTGHKIIVVPGYQGKITKKDIRDVLKAHNDCHMVKPRMVYVSNSTELGTIYLKKELQELYEECQRNNLYLFVDGARLAVALTSKENDMTIQDLAQYSDAFYIGGTKNGLPYGEALIIKNHALKVDFAYHLKNRGAMLAKTFVLALMFKELFYNQLFYRLAEHANLMAEYLRSELTKADIELFYPNPTNQIFICLPNRIVELLSESFIFESWEKFETKTVVRIVTSWSTKPESCERLLKKLLELHS